MNMNSRLNLNGRDGSRGKYQTDGRTAVVEADEYWAAASGKKCSNYLMQYQHQWGDYYSGSTLQITWLRNYLAYYLAAVHPSMVDSSLIPEGLQGELLRMYTPEMRVALRQLVAIISKLRLSFSCVGMSAGTDVIEEIKIGNGLIDQIVQNERLDIKGPQCLEGSIVCGKWFMKAIWSTERGNNTGYRDDNGRPILSGGVEISNVSIFDTFYDIEFTSKEDRDWMMTRVTRNRWVLMAEHPDLADKIKALPATSERTNYNFFLGNSSFNRDNVDVYEFYARPTPALPKGRILIFSDPDAIYVDDVNKYECIPIEEMTPESMLGTGLGYPKMSDLTGTQEMLDNTISAVASNSASFAVHNVLIPRGSNINTDELLGMRWVSYTPQNVPGGGEPKALNLSATAPETFKFIDMLSAKLQDLSMMSGVLRGNPPPGVTSGTAIATLSASSIETLAPYNLAYYYCLEKTMGHAINAFQKFANLDQIVEIEGKNEQKSVRTFNKQSIANLSGVKISNTNPLMGMISGRIEVAEKLMAMPREMWGDYAAILEGQPLSNLYRGEVSKTDLICMENDKMSQGQAVPALATDDHAKHIQLHVAEISDPEVRLSSKNLQIYMNHVMEHYTLAKQTAPDLLYMAQTGKVPEGGFAPATPPGGTPPAQGSSGAPQAGSELGQNSPEPTQPGLGTAGNMEAEGDVAQPSQDLLGRQPA